MVSVAVSNVNLIDGGHKEQWEALLWLTVVRNISYRENELKTTRSRQAHILKVN